MVFLFVPEHGELLEEPWLEGLARRPASTRGRTRRSARRRVLLLPEPGARQVPGFVIEVDEARLRVLDLVQGVGGGGAHRETIRVSMSLRMIEAEAYVAEAR